MTDINDVHKVYGKTLHIENYHLVDIPLAVYKAKDYEGEKVWLNPIAPSGIGKTTAILPLLDLAFDWKLPEADRGDIKYGIFFVDDLTPATFGSGSKSSQAHNDLGYWLEKRNSMLIISDLAPILSMDSDGKNKLFGKFRTVYDGYVKIDTGELSKHYIDIHMNMIAFSTPEVRNQIQMHNQLGTREISYDLPGIRDIDKALKVRDTKENKESRANIVKDFLDDIGKVKLDNIDIETKTSSKLEVFAKTIAKVRTIAVIDKDGYLTEHIKEEYPMRINEQLNILYKSLIALGLEKDEAFYRIWEIVRTCGSPLRKEIIKRLYDKPIDVEMPYEYERKLSQEESPFPSETIEDVTMETITPVHPKSVNDLAYEMNISKQTILTELMVLRDMKMVTPLYSIDKPNELPDIFSCNTQWSPLKKWKFDY